MMSNRLTADGNVEDDASALLKAVALTMPGSDVYRSFQTIDADDMVKGHAWRAIKAVTNNAMLPKWQRAATRDQALRMLAAAAEFAAKPRRDNPREAFNYPSRGEEMPLAHLARLVEKYVAGRLQGLSHDELSAYHLPGRAVRAPKAPPAPKFDIKDRIRSLRLDGHRPTEIVKMTGASRSTVYRVLSAA